MSGPARAGPCDTEAATTPPAEGWAGAPQRGGSIGPVLRTLVLSCTLSAASESAARAMVPLDLCEMKPAFSDDFDALSVNARQIGTARWTAHTPWNGDFGEARFIDPAPLAPFAVADGMLSITAQKGTDSQWRSGLLAAADASGAGSGLRYGYFEARMKMPPGAGTWPAFWLASMQPYPNPDPIVEIDAIEYYGHDTTGYYAATHVWFADKSRSRQRVDKIPVASSALVDDFHTYGVRVAPDVVTFYFDRRPMDEVPTPPELTKPLFPMVDLALGSGWPIDRTPSPSVLLVDYVHTYALDPPGRQERCPSGPAAP